MNNPLCLAIDSGATTSRYVLFRDPGAPVDQGTAQGVNVTEKGLEALRELLREIDSRVAKQGKAMRWP